MGSPRARSPAAANLRQRVRHQAGGPRRVPVGEPAGRTVLADGGGRLRDLRTGRQGHGLRGRLHRAGRRSVGHLPQRGGHRLPVATARSRTAGGPGRESPFTTAYEMANVGTIISATSAIDDRGFIVTDLDAEISSVPASPAAAPQQPSDAPALREVLVDDHVGEQPEAARRELPGLARARGGEHDLVPRRHGAASAPFAAVPAPPFSSSELPPNSPRPAIQL